MSDVENFASNVLERALARSKVLKETLGKPDVAADIEDELDEVDSSSLGSDDDSMPLRENVDVIPRGEMKPLSAIPHKLTMGPDSPGKASGISSPLGNVNVQFTPQSRFNLNKPPLRFPSPGTPKSGKSSPLGNVNVQLSASPLRRTRLRALANTINNWDDDYTHHFTPQSRFNLNKPLLRFPSPGTPKTKTIRKTNSKTSTPETPKTSSEPRESKPKKREKNVVASGNKRGSSGSELKRTPPKKYKADIPLVPVFKVKMDGETKEELYECPQCLKEFSTRKKAVRHYRRHVEEKRFECNQCGRTFFTRSDLQRHYETFLHLNKKLYSCSYCEKSLATEHLRKQHESAHEGIKFRCKSCPKSYVYKKDLVRHVKRHHLELDPEKDTKEETLSDEDVDTRPKFQCISGPKSKSTSVPKPSSSGPSRKPSKRKVLLPIKKRSQDTESLEGVSEVPESADNQLEQPREKSKKNKKKSPP